MSDLISRKKAYEVLTEYYHHCTDVQHKALWDALGRVPDAQPERKKGEWIYNISEVFPADSMMECDQCHAEQPLTCDDNFCPHCGSDMRGGR